MIRTLTIACLLVSAAFVARPALAQGEDGQIPGLQTDGGIVFTVAGQGHSYHTVSFLYDTVRVGSAMVDPGMVDPGDGAGPGLLAIAATGAPDGTGPSFHIQLDLEDLPGLPGAAPWTGPATLTWYPDGEEMPFWSSAGSAEGQTDLGLTRFDFDGQSGHASGSFTARLCLVADIDTTIPDFAQCQAVSGTFDTALYKAF